MKVKHNTQRELTHFAVYAVHDVLRDERVVARLVQVNHYTRRAYKRIYALHRSGAHEFPNLRGSLTLLGSHMVLIVPSPKPPRTIIREKINWRE